MDNSFEEYKSEVKEPKNAKQLRLYTLSHDYLIDNFHKFKESDRIKISLVIVSKYIPTTLSHEGGLAVTQMPIVKIDGKPQELDIGSDPRSSSDS